LRSIICALRQDGEEEHAVSLHSGPAIRARQGQAVFSQGDPSDAVYLLVSGEVAMNVSVEGDEVKSQTTCLFRAPALMGDRDLLAQVPAIEGARCLTAARLLVFPADVFMAQWNSDTELVRALSEDLSRRSAASVLMLNLEALTLPRKLSVLMAALGAGPGQTPDPSYLAAIINATPKSIVRALAQAAPAVPSDDEHLELARRRLFHSLSIGRFRATSRAIPA
jgi:CRP-like cAMP-binding protein